MSSYKDIICAKCIARYPDDQVYDATPCRVCGNPITSFIERDGKKISWREAVNADLQREFGYTPNERDGEAWAVYQDHTLIVIHPERRPRMYKRGCGGVYYEIEPNFS